MTQVRVDFCISLAYSTLTLAVLKVTLFKVIVESKMPKTSESFPSPLSMSRVAPAL